jgi:ribosome assembly protein SQT1
MVFYPEDFVPKLPEIPDTVPICEFMLDEQYGRYSILDSLDPFTCGISGRSFTAEEQKDRVTYLARSLSKELGWNVNQGKELDKVAGIFAQNTVG